MVAMTTIGSRITELEEQVGQLAQLSEMAISRVITAVLPRDPMLARAVIKEDAEIDHA